MYHLLIHFINNILQYIYNVIGLMVIYNPINGLRNHDDGQLFIMIYYFETSCKRDGNHMVALE